MGDKDHILARFKVERPQIRPDRRLGLLTAQR